MIESPFFRNPSKPACSTGYENAVLTSPGLNFPPVVAESIAAAADWKLKLGFRMLELISEAADKAAAAAAAAADAAAFAEGGRLTFALGNLTRRALVFS